MELLRWELSEVRQALAGRDTEPAEARAALGTMTSRADQLASRAGQLETGLAAAQEHAAVGERTYAEAVATIQARYEALSKQLLQEAAHQRDAMQAERAQLVSQLKFAERASPRTSPASGRRARPPPARRARSRLSTPASAPSSTSCCARPWPPRPKPRAPTSTRKSTAKRAAKP